MSKSKKAPKKPSKRVAAIWVTPKLLARPRRNAPPKRTSHQMRAKLSVESPPQPISTAPVENVERCPHGVPKTQTCAICSPDTWRTEHGLSPKLRRVPTAWYPGGLIKLRKKRKNDPSNFPDV
jgi:hypothetical protein